MRIVNELQTFYTNILFTFLSLWSSVIISAWALCVSCQTTNGVWLFQFNWIQFDSIPIRSLDWRSQTPERNQLQLSWKLQAARHEYLSPHAVQKCFFFFNLSNGKLQIRIYSEMTPRWPPQLLLPLADVSLTNLGRQQKYYNTNMIFIPESAVIAPRYRVLADRQTFHLPKVSATKFLSFSLFSRLIPWESQGVSEPILC